MYAIILACVLFGQIQLTNEQQRVLELTNGQQRQVLTNDQLKSQNHFQENYLEVSPNNEQIKQQQKQQESDRIAWYKQQKFEEAYADAQARKWRIRNLPSPWAVSKANHAYYINFMTATWIRPNNYYRPNYRYYP